MSEKPTFDPTKEYKWEPNADFIFTGEEFGAFNAVLSRFLMGNAANVQTILELSQLYNIIRTKIVEGYGKGIVTEIVPADPTSHYPKTEEVSE